MSVCWAVNVDAWHPTATEWAACLACLAATEPDEVARIGKFVFAVDAKRALVGRLLLRAYAHRVLGIAYDAVRFGRTDKGRPVLLNTVYRTETAGATTTSASDKATATAATASAASGQLPVPGARSFDVNVSHHGRWVVLCAAVDALVGCDVMSLDLTAPPSALASPAAASAALQSFFHDLRACFTASEWQLIRDPNASAPPVAPAAGTGAAADSKQPTGAAAAAQNPPLLDGAGKPYRQRDAMTTGWRDALQETAAGAANAGVAAAAAPAEGSADGFGTLTRFMCLWTHKEAVLKCVGVGLGLDLQSIEFRLATAAARVPRVGPGAAAAGASLQRVMSVQLLQADALKNQTRNIAVAPELPVAPQPTAAATTATATAAAGAGAGAVAGTSAAAAEEVAAAKAAIGSAAAGWRTYALADLAPVASRFECRWTALDADHVLCVCVLPRDALPGDGGDTKQPAPAAAPAPAPTPAPAPAPAPAQLGWGAYGIIGAHNQHDKAAEFVAWLCDVRGLSAAQARSLPPGYARNSLWSMYAEDYNSASFPSTKYYNLDAWQAEQAAAGAGVVVTTAASATTAPAPDSATAAATEERAVPAVRVVDVASLLPTAPASALPDADRPSDCVVA